MASVQRILDLKLGTAKNRPHSKKHHQMKNKTKKNRIRKCATFEEKTLCRAKIKTRREGNTNIPSLYIINSIGRKESSINTNFLFEKFIFIVLKIAINHDLFF